VSSETIRTKNCISISNILANCNKPKELLEWKYMKQCRILSFERMGIRNSRSQKKPVISLEVDRLLGI